MLHAYTNDKRSYGKNAHCCKSICARRKSTQWRLYYCGDRSPIDPWLDASFLCLFTVAGSTLLPPQLHLNSGETEAKMIYSATAYTGTGWFSAWIHIIPYRKRSNTHTFTHGCVYTKRQQKYSQYQCQLCMQCIIICISYLIQYVCIL